MGLPKEFISLSPEQIQDLHGSLRRLRHDINGDLAVIAAAAELIKLNPVIKELIERDPKGTVANMLQKLIDKPPVLRDRITHFSAELEKELGITKP